MIDVGANGGMETAAMRRSGHTVYAVECLPSAYIPIPLISTLLSAISFSLMIFDSTGSELFRTDAASFTIPLIRSLGSFAKLILFNINDKKITNHILKIFIL